MLLGLNRTSKTTKKPFRISSLEFGSAEHFNVSVRLSFRGILINALALIDSGATSNFIHVDFVKTHKIPQLAKDKPIPLEVADGHPISSGHITHSTIPMTLFLDDPQHIEEITFDIAPLGRHQVILGIPWIYHHP
jgi:hypothetical protein